MAVIVIIVVMLVVVECSGQVIGLGVGVVGARNIVTWGQ